MGRVSPQIMRLAGRVVSVDNYHHRALDALLMLLTQDLAL